MGGLRSRFYKELKFSEDLKIFITKTLRRTLIAVHNIMGKKVVQKILPTRQTYMRNIALVILMNI